MTGLSRRLRWLRLLAAGIGVLAAQAQANCWVEAAQRHRVDPWLLYAIAKQESGLNPLARGSGNANGSYDIGLMQINSSHLPVLKRHGIDEQHLYDPCVSIHVGAWILGGNFQRLGYGWDAVGAYNAKSPDKRVRYAWKVFQQLEKTRAGMAQARKPLPSAAVAATAASGG
jgi:soluble lytic murein transglycosylase-like protein